MERSGPETATPSERFADLVELYEAAGPYLTVCMSTAASDERSLDRLEVAWENARAAAADAGAPDALLDTCERHVAGSHQRGDGLVLVGAADRVLLAEHLAEAPRDELARWSSLPSLSVVIEQRQRQLPYVVVLTDHTGADIISMSVAGRSSQTEVDETHGQPVTKSAPGGWSQPRYQQRAENTWEHNARAAADRVTETVDRVDARLVMVAGGDRAVSMLERDMPSRLRPLVRRVRGGRAADGSDDEFETDVDRTLRTEAAAVTTHLLERYEQERASHSEAVAEIDGVLAALSAAQVDVLLVHDDPEDDSSAWFDPDGLTVAVDRSLLASIGVEPCEGRLVDAAIRSTLRGGGSPYVVPRAALPTGSIGALLRWG